VLGQQISVAGATTLARRLVAQFGAGISAFPTPAHLCEAELESIGLPKARANTLRALARAVCDRHIDFAPGQNIEDFIRQFCLIPGIGPWTAHYVAMRALAHPDAFPAGDLVLQNVLGGAKRLSEKATEASSQAWRPWRAYAVMHLWFCANEQAKSTSLADKRLVAKQTEKVDIDVV
jgi:AraC family transcriptional regulator, regulatory protein of adaptative response / DNA-3-methyladenine glycosylase II